MREVGASELVPEPGPGVSGGDGDGTAGGLQREDWVVPRQGVCGDGEPRKEVVVQFDAGTAEWVISDRGGVELCQAPLDPIRRYGPAAVAG